MFVVTRFVPLKKAKAPKNGSLFSQEILLGFQICDKKCYIYFIFDVRRLFSLKIRHNRKKTGFHVFFRKILLFSKIQLNRT